MTKDLESTINELSDEQLEKFASILKIIKTEKDGRVSHKTIYKYCGKPGRQYHQFFAKYLVQKNRHYKVGESYKQYVINPYSYFLINKELDDRKLSIKEESLEYSSSVVYNRNWKALVEKYAEELESGQFNYNRKSFRDYHELQNLNGSTRSTLFQSVGYGYEYDVKSAIISLSYTEFRRLGGESKPLIEQYLSNPDRYRKQLSRKLGLPVSTIKTCITALCNLNAISKTVYLNGQQKK
jgi:hypothetical protein